jgi:hypothetical protein
MTKTAIPELLNSVFLIFQEGINSADMVSVRVSGTHKLQFGFAWPFVHQAVEILLGLFEISAVYDSIRTFTCIIDRKLDYDIVSEAYI